MGEKAAAPRRPRQERGRRRFDAILDGVAAMVAEAGVAGVTVHGVARRSGTAIGSIYHFFPDRDSMLTALADRHAEAVRERTEGLRSGAVDWGALAAREAVRRYLAPILSYIEEHPDYLPVMRAMSGPGGVARRHPELMALAIEVSEGILRARSPELPAEALRARGATMIAVIDGVLSMMLRPMAPPREALLRELERVLAAYVGAG